ncbi:MAG: tyrosine-type recombinase/integrase [Candidatus Nanohaloarchaea archaeon]
MGDDPDQYLENIQDDISEENWEALKQFRREADIANSTTYDYLSRLNNILQTCAPDGFQLSEPSKDEILDLANNIQKEKDNPSTMKSWLKSVKKFYGVYKGGEYYELTDSFTVSAGGASGTTVEPDMILSPPEVQSIVNSAQTIRTKAYIRVMYEVAATPGELLQGKLKDVDLTEETIYVRGNKNHRSQTMELHSEGVNYLREYLKMHPAVDDPFSTTSEEPLWVKSGGIDCKNCGESQTAHINGNMESCDSFEADEAAAVGYRTMNKAFKKAVQNSDIERDVKAKYLRKSMLTRLAPEVGYEQLNNFARWQPGSSQAQSYISINNEKLRNMVKERFKGESEESQKWIVCENCNARNDPERIECKKCHRPLNVAKSEKMKKVKSIADRLSQVDEQKLEKIEQNIDILENPQEFIQEEIQRQMAKE